MVEINFNLGMWLLLFVDDVGGLWKKMKFYVNVGGFIWNLCWGFFFIVMEDLIKNLEGKCKRWKEN